MNKALTFAAVTLSAQVALSALNSTNYVQAGLLVQLDGIENKARGEAHDETVTRWTVLTGNGYSQGGGKST